MVVCRNLAPMTLSAAFPSRSIFSPLSHGSSAPQLPELQIDSFHCSHQKLTLQIFLTDFISVKSRFVWFFLRMEKLPQLMSKEERRGVGLQILLKQACSCWLNNSECFGV